MNSFKIYKVGYGYLAMSVSPIKGLEYHKGNLEEVYLSLRKRGIDISLKDLEAKAEYPL